MISLNRKTEYGLIAMTHLARMAGGDLASAREIAEAYSLSRSLVMNVLKELGAAGFVESTRGSRGGYRLSRPPEAIGLGEVLESLEQPMRLTPCVHGGQEVKDRCSCGSSGNCPICEPIHLVQQRMEDVLRGVTLADIALAPAGAAGGERT